MSYQKFMMFFTTNNIQQIKIQRTIQPQFLAVAPVEQYMISSGRRLFKRC